MSGPSVAQRAVALLALALTLIGFATHLGMAAVNGKIITLGESLSDAQRQELLAYFDAKSDDKIQTVTVADTRAAMDGIVNADFETAYSSTALSCRPLGKGLVVSTHNITLITPGMFAMALVTAGIGDAELVVASPDSALSSGQAALSGVFKTWRLAPCDSGDTNAARQRLALEELSLTAEFGLAISDMTAAGNIVLNVQKTVVIEHLKKATDIEATVKVQEAANGVTMSIDQRAKLVDLMVRLARQNVDWGTFSAGWQITQPNGAKIVMIGDGIAIRNAQRTATADAFNTMTATAEAAVNRAATARANTTATAGAHDAMTATVEAAANATGTARANMTANARAAAQQTQEASGALTTTAQAIPTETPVPPTATATPPSTSVSGTITGSSSGSVTIKPESGGADATYRLTGDVPITRGGSSASIDALEKGDSITMTVDFANQVTGLAATPIAPADGLNPVIPIGAVVLTLCGVLGWLLMKARGRDEPFVIKRVSAA